MKEFQELIDKVSELRHSKVKQRQINKFNKLIQKEGTITWQCSQGTQGSASSRKLGLVHHRKLALLIQQIGLAFPRQLTLQLMQLRSSSFQAGSFSPQVASANSPYQIGLPR